MKVVGLFAGIGGIELGLQRSGHETLLLCEKDPAGRAVLGQHFPQVPIHDDVTTLDELPDGTELVAAGFPCQDLSQAGQTGGISGRRSGLVSHVFRLLRGRSVPWVLIENVPFMLQLDRGAAMAYVVSELEALGYSWAYRVADSRAFGLPQRRRRVYLLASLEESPEARLFSEDAGTPEALDPEGRACGFYWTEGNRGLGWAVDAIPTLKGGSGLGIPSPPAIWLPDDRIVTPDIRDAERLQGFDEGWTLPAAGVARPSYRWKLIGNAVSVPAAAWIGSLLHGPRPSRFRPEEAEPSSRWSTAAYGSSSGRFPADFSEWPIRVQRPPLADFLAHPAAPLSERATAGFLDRLKRSSLKRSDEFVHALEAHLAGYDRAAS